MEEEHYYTEEPKSRYREHEIKARIRNFDLYLKSASGVFSLKEIDSASKLLIEKAELPKSGRILDLGCGYGAIGIVAAKACPGCDVILTDINRRAVKLAIENVLLNRVNAEVRQGSIYEPVKGEKFDVILLNPPIVAGRDIVLSMIRQAPAHLNKNGSLQIVARKTKGGEFLFKEMKKIFSEVKVLAKSGGFWVVKGVK
ncbi:MAG TPA: methyltransferase [Candidatus Nanoarchaeia archaeon]|nr:methyltransferase [Candidatus Nanoarchaeia archaeon]